MSTPKFRIWSIADQEWMTYIKVPPDLDNTPFWRSLHNEITLDMAIENTQDFIVQQCTGLKDKNGREIHEGDIVRHRNGEKIVQWDTASASFQMELSPYIYDQEAGYSSNQVEVVGFALPTTAGIRKIYFTPPSDAATAGE